MRKLFIVLSFLLFFTGCAPSAYISSLTDPTHTLHRTDPIYISTNGSSIRDRQFYPLVRSEMEASGFNIVDSPEESKYYLLFSTASDTSKIHSTYYDTQTSTSTSYISGTPHTTTTKTTTAYPYSYDYTVKKVYFFLYLTEDIRREVYMTVWEGYVGAGEDDYKEYERSILKSLFDVFGTDYEAHTTIDTNYGK